MTLLLDWVADPTFRPKPRENVVGQTPREMAPVMDYGGLNVNENAPGPFFIPYSSYKVSNDTRIRNRLS
jgi:hypothetical protein